MSADTPTQVAARVPVSCIAPLRVPGWEAFAGLVHGFCGRRGGASAGDFAELNVSFRVGDATAAVDANWHRVAALTGGRLRFATMRQQHGDVVATVGSTVDEPPTADALATAAAGVGLSVLTADCVPILMVAPEQRVVAAVHAGWRGTLAGIGLRAVRVLAEQFAARPATIHAALGPAIGGCCYEVDASVADAFESRYGTCGDGIQRARLAAKVRLDLRHINMRLLHAAGLPPHQTVAVGPCTSCAESEYFSYRAAGGVTGRQLSFIGWSD